MNITCPHCSQTLELTPEVHAQLQGQPHFACPTCQGLMTVPPLPAAAKQAPRRATDVQKAAMHAQRGLNRNMLVLGIIALLALGGLATFLASRNGGSVFNIFQNITNQIIHNTYFTQLIADGVTTEKDLESIGDIRPYGDGFIGISKEPLTWEQAQDLAKRTGAEVLAIEDSAAGTRQQLTEWLNTMLASHLASTLWVRQDGQTRVLDKRDVMSVTTLDSPRKTILRWTPNSGRTTTDPALATKELPFVNSLGMKFVPVPIMGGPTSGKKVLFSVWETRVQDYVVFAKETKRQWPDAGYEQGPTHPAVMVSWDDAQSFCVWLTEMERKAGKMGANEGYCLPTDHEWSCAVGIGEREDAAKLPSEKSSKLADVFPWSTAWPPPPKSGNYWSEELRPLLAAGKFSYIKWELPGYHDGYATTAPVGSYPANRFGLFDLSGNVSEWSQSWYDAAQKERTTRDCAWHDSSPGWFLSSTRGHVPAATRFHTGGFRCVLETSAPAVIATVDGKPITKPALEASAIVGRWKAVSSSGWTGTYEFHADSTITTEHLAAPDQQSQWKIEGGVVIVTSVAGQDRFTMSSSDKLIGTSARGNHLTATRIKN